MSRVYLNGQWVAKKDAKVSIFDRGFLFADAAYEVVPIFSGKPFQFDPHIARLKRSCAELGFSIDVTSYSDVLDELLKDVSKDFHGVFYIQVSRGVDLLRNHVFDSSLSPHVVAFLQPKQPLSREASREGFAALLAEDPRWNRCDIKSVSLLPNVIHKNKASQAGATETLFHVNGVVSEGTSSNIFVVQKGVVYTAPSKENILNGVTRLFLISELKKAGVEVLEQTVTVNELLAADEVWITSSTINVLPIVKVGEITIGSGAAGPLWCKAFDIFEKAIQ